MASLCIRPSGLPAPKNWVLVLRAHESIGEVEYTHVGYLDDERAVACVEAAAPVYWLYGEPDWEEQRRQAKLEDAKQLRVKAAEIEASVTQEVLAQKSGEHGS